MSTHCRVGMILGDGRFKSIYVHFDGYPSGVGATLKKFWDGPERVRELIDLGDRSSIVEGELDPSQCYVNKGEPDAVAIITEDMQNFRWDYSMEQYCYVFDPSTKEWKEY